MAFKEVQDLDCEVTTALGGVNKKTGKPNPKQAVGYFLGTKQTASKKARSGFAALHVLQTENGNVGIWGKTDLDRKMQNVTPGAMVRITQSGKVNTTNGDMYKYKVEVDLENSIEVEAPTASTVATAEAEEAVEASNYDEGYVDAEALEDEDEATDEVTLQRAVPPRKAATTPDAARQAKVQALLNGARTKRA